MGRTHKIASRVSRLNWAPARKYCDHAPTGSISVSWERGLAWTAGAEVGSAETSLTTARAYMQLVTQDASGPLDGRARASRTRCFVRSSIEPYRAQLEALLGLQGFDST